MKNLKKTLLAALSLTVFTAACAEGPMAPDMADVPLMAAFGGGNGGGNQDDGDPDGDSQGVDGPLVLEWLTPLAQDITVSALCEVGKRCSLKIDEVDAELKISSGSLGETTLITMTALAGSAVNFQFGPHGTQFLSPVEVDVSTSLTTANDKRKGNFFALYWVEDLEDVWEQLPAELHKGRVFFYPEHFSGYAIAM